jgi:hypothetical protein
MHYGPSFDMDLPSLCAVQSDHIWSMLGFAVHVHEKTLVIKEKKKKTYRQRRNLASESLCQRTDIQVQVQQ